VKSKYIGNVSGPVYYKLLSLLSSDADAANGTFAFYFNISYAGASAIADQHRLLVNVSGGSDPIIRSVYLGPEGTTNGVSMDFKNKTAWTSTAASPEFRLGSSDSSEDNDVNVTTTDLLGTAASHRVGKKSQDIVSDAGNIVLAPDSNAASNRVKVQVPAEALKVKAYVGKYGEAAGEKYKVFAGVTTALGKLDSEVTSTDKANKHLVLVGGPCANKLVQELVDNKKLDDTYTCAGGVPSSAWTEGVGYIIAVDDAFATGRIALVAAGTKAPQTRTACTVLQQYDTLLKGITASAIKVTSATAAGITAL
jgi:hypothetical protein